MARTGAWTVYGALFGGIIGVVSAGFSRPPVGEATLPFVARHSMVGAGELAGIAAIFAASDTVLGNVAGRSAMTSAVAGCAAGSLLGIRQGSVVNAAYGCGVFAVLQGSGALSFEMNGPEGGH